MSDTVLELDGVFKKFRRGEIYDSLRDLIPAVTGRYLRGRAELIEKREFWALKDVSFAVRRGEAVGIVGRNGAGKSTILKLLSGVMRPNRGTVQVAGRLSALIEVGAGFHPDLTGRENIFLNAAILGMSRKEIQAKFDEIVEFSGLSEFIDTPVKRYSSGMYARLGFSVAIHVEPDILLVDEVLSVGDHVFQTRCLERMHEISNSGTTVLFVSHNLRAVSELCTRSVLIEKGELVFSGESNEVIRRYLAASQQSRDKVEGKAAHLTEVTVRGADGPKVRFDSGERAWVEIECLANEPLNNVAIAIEVRNESYLQIFNTSSERLGHPTYDVRPGEKFRVCFELTLHLATGTFHVGAFAFRSDTEKQYDYWFPAATLYVSPDRDVRGSVNLYPRIMTGDREHG